MDRVLQNTALIAAIAAAIGWALNKIYDIVSARLTAKRDRRTAIVRFYIDCRLRRRYVAKLINPPDLEEMRGRTADLLRSYQTAGRAYRMVGVQIVDQSAQEAVLGYLSTFPTEVGELIAEVVLLDRTMSACYDKMQSDAFASMDADRQIAVVDDWIDSARSLLPELDRVLFRLGSIVGIGRRDDHSRDGPRPETSAK